MARAAIRIPWARADVGERESELVQEALRSTWISGGAFVDRLEKEFLARHGKKHGVSCSNGTTALHAAYLALGIRPGDEVIVPGFTFAAPANIALAMGAVPVYADVDPRTWLLDPKEVEQKITNKTKAVVPVHIYGNVCAMDRILEVCRSRGVAVVEDTAEGLFSKYRGRLAGTLGEIGCYSFQATKTITTGEGGFVVTDDAALAERLRLFRNHGMSPSKRYWHEVAGFNFRLTNLQAAVGCAQLERVDEFLAQRRHMAEGYARELKRVPGATPQHVEKEVDINVWAVGVKLDPKAYPQGRDAVIDQLEKAGIETRPGFFPFSVMPVYRAPRLPVSETVGLNVISLPSFPTLTDDEIASVCSELARLARS
ncbi:MAG: DegT/DnrJ/EryC1/StrS family aminotransferase [Elusimicrobia bacterium]|nr:DegT/DnrJ/EryC1/StrS family aminotransferase [Elusimicrobiota bacterium]